MNTDSFSNFSMRNAKLLSLGAVLLLVAGCKSVGPKTIPRDRFSYSSALAESWKSQMLLNLVKTRYLDLPIYLEVGQIVSGYSLETSGNLGGQLSSVGAIQGDSLVIGGAARFTDRPTITYTPLTGDKFLEGFLTPVDPARVFALIQAGYAVDFVLEMSLDSLNGLRNHPVTLGSKQKADPEFFRVLWLLREIQDAAAAGVRVERATNNLPTSVLFFRSDRVEPAVLAQMAEARELLGLAPGQFSYRIVQSPLRGGSGELAVSTRSLSQLLVALSLGVEVPAAHVARKLTPPMPSGPSADRGLLRVQSGERRPVDAFVAVSYEGAWFWIANDDWKSKRAFSSILFMFTLADTGSAQKMPTLTIPAQ